MGKNTKGLVRDTRPQDQPPETIWFGKNGILNYVKRVSFNEPGFTISPAVVPAKTIGIVETDKKPVFFSTDNVVSYIGFYDPETDTYQPIFNDSTTDFKLNFSTDNYIKGEAQRNYRNELIVVWTDKVQPLGVINCDRPETIETLNDLRFFLEAQPMVITATVQNEGSLLTGAYYIFAKYVRNDGAETAYIANSDVKTVSNTTVGVGDKSIQISISSMDVRYDKIRLAVVSKIGGQLTAVEIEDIPIGDGTNSTINFTYNGGELTTPATVLDVLTQPAVYQTVGALGQLNDSLYLGDLTTVPEINWQKYAMMLKLNWVAEEVDIFLNQDALVRGELKTFMHFEAYAFYARLLTTDGKRTKAFVIPGPELTSADRATSTKGTAAGLTQPKWQLEDTIPTSTKVGNQLIGQMGKWENSSEVYPDDPSFDASDVGGPNLRGQKVRHHRMPSLEYTKPYFSKEHGRSSLDRLGIQVTNIVIPADLKDKISGIEILYAKRTGENMTVIGQSTILMDMYSKGAGPAGEIFTAGGNWWTTSEDKNRWGDFNDGETLLPREDYARFYPFDMLFNRPSISIDYVRPIIKMRMKTIGCSHEFEDGNWNGDKQFIGYLLDYTQPTDVDLPTTPFAGRVLKMEEGKYIPYNSIAGRYRNLFVGSSYAGKITPFNAFQYAQQTYNVQKNGFTRCEKLVPSEETALCMLMKIRADMYNTFYLQTLITTNITVKPDTTGTIVWGGDSFLCAYTFHTFGYVDRYDDHQNKQARVVRRIVCESASNINARYEITAEPNSRFFPKSQISVPRTDDPNTYVHAMDNKKEVNIFGYSKDLNALNELSNVRVWIPEPNNNELTDFPYRIHRGGKVSRTGRIRNWQTLLPLDYFETQKNMGRIVNLCGMLDRLLIHHEKALFATQDKTKLETDLVGVTLGTGDIFQFEPQPVQNSKLGYGGTIHDLACVLTPIGYVFVDAMQGQAFLYNGELKLLNLGLNTFLQEFLKLQDTNIFIGNGITIGYDPEYKRLLLTVKNQVINEEEEEEAVRYDYKKTSEYYATLVPGVSLVYKDGRVQRFIGPNQSQYSCGEDNPPTLFDSTFTVEEGSPVGTFLGTITAVGGTPGYTYLLLTPSDYQINATTGVVTVANPPDYTGNGQVNIPMKVIDSKGLSAQAVLHIQVTRVDKGPTVPDYEFEIPESQPARVIGTIVATPGDSFSLSYSIISGNTGNDLTIGSGSGTLSSTKPLNTSITDTYTLVIRVTDGNGEIADSNVIVRVIEIPDPPIFPSKEVTIKDTHALGSLVLQMDLPDDPDGDDELLVTTIVGSDGPDTFDVDLETMTITLSPDANLDPQVKNKYQIHFRSTDETGRATDAVATIHVVYDTALYQFSPFGYNCSGSTCPAGSSPSPDDTECVKVEDSAATAPPTTVVMKASPRVNAVYTTYGSYIYSPGFNINGTGTRSVINLSNGWWRNIPANTVDGPLNRLGLWNTDPDDQPFNTWIGFTVQINIPSSKIYYIGLAGDNKCRILLNGVTVVEQDPVALGVQNGGGNIDVAFKEYHLYPVNAPAGLNILTLEGWNDGIAGSFGAEIYDNTEAQLRAATSYSGLNIVWSTKDLRNGDITSGVGNYTCSVAGAQPIQENGVWICRKITRTPKQASLKTIRAVKIESSRWIGRTIMILLNQPGQTYEGLAVPYYPTENASPDCSGVLHSNISQAASSTRTTCPDNNVGGSINVTVGPALYQNKTAVEVANQMAFLEAQKRSQHEADQGASCTPVCPTADQFTGYVAGNWCTNDDVQIVIRAINASTIREGIRFSIRAYQSDNVLIGTFTTGQVPADTTEFRTCFSKVALLGVERVEIISVIC